jgi:hypothetical protein
LRLHIVQFDLPTFRNELGVFMKKFTKLAVIAGTLCFVATGALAGLKLCSQAGVPQVNVACGATLGSVKDTGYPIPSGGCANGGIMPWSIVRQKLDPSSGNGVCVFSIAGQQVGTASVSASMFSGTVNTASVNPPYTTDPSTFPITGSDLTVTINKASNK